MKSKKAEIRSIVLDVVQGREKVAYPYTKLDGLSYAVAEIIQRRRGPTPGMHMHHDKNLDSTDSKILLEVFWDLVLDRVLTIGSDEHNPNFPSFRMHSEAEENLKKLSS